MRSFGLLYWAYPHTLRKNFDFDLFSKMGWVFICQFQHSFPLKLWFPKFHLHVKFIVSTFVVSWTFWRYFRWLCWESWLNLLCGLVKIMSDCWRQIVSRWKEKGTANALTALDLLHFLARFIQISSSRNVQCQQWFVVNSVDYLTRKMNCMTNLTLHFWRKNMKAIAS